MSTRERMVAWLACRDADLGASSPYSRTSMAVDVCEAAGWPCESCRGTGNAPYPEGECRRCEGTGCEPAEAS